MLLEENKVIIRKLVEAINSQNLSALDKLVAPDFVYNTPGQKVRGLEAMKQGIMEEIRSFPDLHVVIEDILAEGEKVCVRLKETATHIGEFRGLVLDVNYIYKSKKQNGVFYKFIKNVDDVNGKFLRIDDLYTYTIPYKDMEFWCK